MERTTITGKKAPDIRGYRIQVGDKDKGINITPVDEVTIYYKCCECGYVESMPLNDHLGMASLCGECNHLENFLEIIGITIKE